MERGIMYGMDEKVRELERLRQDQNGRLNDIEAKVADLGRTLGELREILLMLGRMPKGCNCPCQAAK